MKALKRLCGIALMLMMTVGFMPMMPGVNGVAEADTQPEFYAVLNTAAEGTEGQAGYKPAYTLSFYYDGNKSTHTESTKTVYADLPIEASSSTGWGYESVCQSIKNVVIDASVANYSGLKSTYSMFFDMENADNISGCEYLNVSNVTNMASMFEYFACNSTSITAVPNVSDWDTSKVTSMKDMFEQYAFSSTNKLNPLDLSGWDISSLENAQNMFRSYNRYCTSGNPIVYATDWSTIKATNVNSLQMFTLSRLKNANTVIDGDNQWSHANTGNTGCFTKAVASITTQSGTTKYATVQAAVNAASGQTVKIIADSTENVKVENSKNVTLDLNGHVLKADLSDGQKHSVIINEGTLTIIDTATTNNTHYFKVDTNGLWVLDDTLTTADYIFDADNGLRTAVGEATTDIPAKDKVIKVSGGCITGGTGTEAGTSLWCGGGIYNVGTLSLQGGNIVGNNPTTGGGVYNEKSFTMSAGTIAGNALPDDDGGGVNNCGNINMTGGIISSNTANEGGGIFSDGDLNMTGGTISGNTVILNAAGVKANGGNVLLGGTIRISNNTAGTKESNLQLHHPKVTIGTGINVPKKEMSVGVTLWDYFHGSGDIGVAGAFTTSGTNTDIQYFHSDIDEYLVRFVKGNTSKAADDPLHNDHLELVYAYNVTEATCTNGSVSVGATKKYAKGDTVTLTNTPDNGYEFDKYSVFKTGDEATAVAETDGKFTMPAYDVTVSATFMKLVCFIDSNDNGKFDNDETKYGSIGKAIGTSKPALESESTPTKIVLIANDTENVTIPEGRNITIDLNGKTLMWSDDDDTSPVILNQGTLTIKDSGTGGKITGANREASNGGGVINHDGGTFNMSGGSITGNSANEGGGVFNSGTFNMSGGSITGNSADEKGGGVVNHTGGTFNMSGGSISGNTAGDYGGGIYNFGNMNVSGKSVITGNKIGEGGTATDNNVYLTSGKMITVGTGSNPVKYLESGAYIGVTTKDTPSKGNPLAITGNNSADYSSYFHSDNGSYKIYNTKSGEVQIVKSSVHEHVWTYSATGDTLKAWCAEEFGNSNCDDYGESKADSVKIVAPERTVYGDTTKSNEATLSGSTLGDLTITASDIKYYKKGETAALASAPTDAGTYQASITIGTGSDAKTASVEYTIAKAAPTVTTPPNASAITYGQALSNSTLSGGEGSVDGSFAWTDPTKKPSVSDSDTTEYDVTFTPADVNNYSEASCKVKLTVNKAKVDLPKASKDLVYNGSVLTGVALPTDAVYTLSGNTSKDAGAYTATATLNDKTNYEWNLEASTSEDQDISWSIDKKQLVITADNKTTYMKEELKPLTYTAGKLVGNDEFEGMLSTSADKNKVGKYDIVQNTLNVKDGNDGKNYEILYTKGTYEVTAKEVQALSFSGVSAGNVSKTYGDAKFTQSVSGAQTSVKYSSSDGEVASVDSKTGELTIHKAGIAVIKATAEETTKYAEASAQYILTVNRKQIAISADSKTTYLYEELEALTYTADKLIGSDEFNGVLATDADKDVAGTYKISKGTLTAGNNYTIQFTEGSYVVEDPEVEEGFNTTGKAYKHSIKYSWNAVEGATKYKVYFARCGSKKYKCVKTTKLTSFTKKKLARGTGYKIYVKAYDDDGKLIEKTQNAHIMTKGGKYSNATEVKAEPELSVTQGQTARVLAKITDKDGNKSLYWRKHVKAKIRYYSSDKSVAKVNKYGKITGVGRGVAYIYSVAPSGVSATTKVRVLFCFSESPE